MWKLGKRWQLFGHPDERHVEGAPVRPVGPSDAEVIARVARHVLRIDATTGFDDRAEALRDIRAILVRSDAGRAVLGRPLEALGEDPVDVLTRERDAARDEKKRRISHYETRLEALRQRTVEAKESRDAMSIELGEWMRAAAEARAERDEATRELRANVNGYRALVEGILDVAPESWDGEDSGHSIALGYVRELEARLDALRVPRDKFCERPDGSVWPDARTDPNGFADAARAYQEMHSGCRCAAFGERTPEHAPSVLCKPRPGDRRCTNPVCSQEGEFGHEDQRVAPNDPWSSGDGTAPVAVGRRWPQDRADDVTYHPPGVATHPDDPRACRNALGEISGPQDCVINHDPAAPAAGDNTQEGTTQQ